MQREPVAIVGGGIGGLTLAIALRRRGVRATVYEAAPRLEAVGAGIWMPPKAMQVLARLGLAECVAVEDSPEEARVHLAGGDEVAAEVVVGADGVHSAVRRFVLGEVRLRYSGQTAYRAVVRHVLPAAREGIGWEVWAPGCRFGFSTIAPGERLLVRHARRPGGAERGCRGGGGPAGDGRDLSAGLLTGGHHRGRPPRSAGGIHQRSTPTKSPRESG